MDFVDFICEISAFKEVKRSGWEKYSIEESESVPDHIFAVSVLALSISLPDDIDRNRLVKMSLIHDLGEIETGDILSEEGETLYEEKKDEERDRERATVKEFADSTSREEINELHKEFVQQETRTSKFLRELDKLDMAA